MKHKIKLYIETTSDCDLISANTPITKFSCNSVHHFSTKTNCSKPVCSASARHLTSAMKVHISVRYISNTSVFICRDKAFTALTAAVAGSAVLSAGPSVVRTTDTWAAVRMRSQHPNTACSSKQTLWNTTVFQLEILCNHSDAFIPFTFQSLSIHLYVPCESHMQQLTYVFRIYNSTYHKEKLSMSTL